MILPTKTYRDEEVKDESGYFQILSDLHLCGASQYSAAEIVYLPTPLPSSQTIEPKLGPIQEAISEWLNALPELALWKAGTTRSDLLEQSPNAGPSTSPCCFCLQAASKTQHGRLSFNP